MHSCYIELGPMCWDSGYKFWGMILTLVAYGLLMYFSFWGKK